MKKKTKNVVIGIVVGIIALIAVLLICFGCSSQQNTEPNAGAADVPADVSPAPEDTSDESSADSGDFSAIVDDYSDQIDDKADTLSSEYEQAKFVNGESDAQLSKRASDGYDALKKLFEAGKAKLQSEKNAHTGSDAMYTKALDQLEQNYNNSVQRLKDDILNLNS